MFRFFSRFWRVRYTHFAVNFGNCFTSIKPFRQRTFQVQCEYRNIFRKELDLSCKYISTIDIIAHFDFYLFQNSLRWSEWNQLFCHEIFQSETLIPPAHYNFSCNARTRKSTMLNPIHCSAWIAKFSERKSNWIGFERERKAFIWIESFGNDDVNSNLD